MVLFLWSEQISVLWVWHEVRQGSAGHLSSSFWVFQERPALSHCSLLLEKLPLRLPHRTVPVHGCSASLWCHHLCLGEEGEGREEEEGWQSRANTQHCTSCYNQPLLSPSVILKQLRKLQSWFLEGGSWESTRKQDMSTAGLTSVVSRSCKVTDYHCEFSHDGVCVVHAQGSKCSAWNRYIQWYTRPYS